MLFKKTLKGVDGWLEWILKMRLNYSYRKDLLLYSIFESQAYKKVMLMLLTLKLVCLLLLKLICKRC